MGKHEMRTAIDEKGRLLTVICPPAQADKLTALTYAVIMNYNLRQGDEKRGTVQLFPESKVTQTNIIICIFVFTWIDAES